MGDALAAVLLALASPPAAPSPAVEVSFCKLTRHADRYIGRFIHTQAEMLDASPHGWFFQAAGCNEVVAFGGDGAADSGTSDRMMRLLMLWSLASGPSRPLTVAMTARPSWGVSESGSWMLYLAVIDVDMVHLPISTARPTPTTKAHR